MLKISKSTSVLLFVIQGFSEIHTSQYISKVLKGQDKAQAVLKFNKNNFMADRKQFTCPMLILFICILVNHDELDLARKNVALGEIYWRLLEVFTGSIVRRQAFSSIIVTL